MTLIRTIAAGLTLATLLALLATPTAAQSVCLPAPRLLTMMPMGGQTGTSFDVTISGESIDTGYELLFSDPRITAVPKQAADGTAIPHQFVVTIAADAPLGIHEARLMTRLGVSSCRAFTVGSMAEVVRRKPNTSLETAMPLEHDTICNASTTDRAIDYYTFQAKQGQRLVIECAATGIDSKLTPVLILANADGADLMVERRGGRIDFTAPADGRYVIKVQSLTYQGGPEHFYRLVLDQAAPGATVASHPATESVSSVSWPPVTHAIEPSLSEREPENPDSPPQPVTLPVEISGSFYPAADVDTYEFAGKKGETWWIEVASARLGRSTDPFVLVQRIEPGGSEEKLIDVAELTDIPSPIKISSNGYSYDGPFYNAGSPDVLGKVDLPEDGIYRVQVWDLFGGTRNDPENVYHLSIRKAAPDFALVTWAQHMTLRNGDRNALSKPLALRPGVTMPFEVIVIRRDGFNGEITLSMDGLPEGVTATGLKIPAGSSVGTLLITADSNAPRGLALAKIQGHAEIDGKPVSRDCRLASLCWPSKNANQEIPNPRLMADIPVSVGGFEKTPLTVAASEDKVWEAVAGEKLTIPLTLTWRGDFSGAFSLKAFGPVFGRMPELSIPLKSETASVELDLAALKVPAGEHVLGLYGKAVANYRYHPEAVEIAELKQQRAVKNVEELTALVTKLTAAAKSASAEQKAAADAALKKATADQKTAVAAKAAADREVQAATRAAKPSDIVDIVAARPIRIHVKPAP